MTTDRKSGAAAHPERDHETPGFSLPYKAGLITGPDESVVRELVANLEKSEAKRAQWPRDGRQAMAALAKLLPSMRDVPGTDPWNAELLIGWCNTGAPTSGSGWIARFFLSVWNPSTNWNEYGLPGAGKFDLMEAWPVLDGAHQAGIIKWLEAPFWP
jgi:hypothetical protein